MIGNYCVSKFHRRCVDGADSSPVVFIEHTAEREMVDQGMMGREKGSASFSLYPSHLALPFLVPISPSAVSLLYEDDWGRVSRRGSVVIRHLCSFSVCNCYFFGAFLPSQSAILSLSSIYFIYFELS